MKLRNFLLALSLILVAFGLAACGGDEDGNADSGSNDDGSGNDGEEVTLHVAALESAYGKEVWENIAEQYEALNDNVTIDLKIAKNLEEVISQEMQSGDYTYVILIYIDREKSET